MTFEEVLDQAIAMLQRRGRVTYRALKRQFNLDDAFLEDLKEELLYGQQLAVEEDAKVLVWTGGADRASLPAPPVAFMPAAAPLRAPLSYTPPYLTEKILDARPRRCSRAMAWSSTSSKVTALPFGVVGFHGWKVPHPRPLPVGEGIGCLSIHQLHG